MSRPKNLCGYCNRPARLTREHIWGQWLDKEMAAVHPDTAHVVSSGAPNGDISRFEAGPLNRQGNIRGTQLRIACRECNGGWMRLTNEAAAPTIKRLLIEGPYSLTNVERSAFAKWAAMLSMSYEFADRQTMATPPVEREYIRHYDKPPPNWSILIGRYSGGFWRETINHRFVANQNNDELQNITKRGQCTVFAIENTAVITISGSLSYDYRKFIATHYPLSVVWPSDGDLLINPFFRTLTDAEMYQIAKLHMDDDIPALQYGFIRPGAA